MWAAGSALEPDTCSPNYGFWVWVHSNPAFSKLSLPGPGTVVVMIVEMQLVAQ